MGGVLSMVDLRMGWLMENPLKMGDFWVENPHRKAHPEK